MLRNSIIAAFLLAVVFATPAKAGGWTTAQTERDAYCFPVMSADNPYIQAWGTVLKTVKVGICLAETNQSYAGRCE